MILHLGRVWKFAYDNKNLVLKYIWNDMKEKKNWMWLNHDQNNVDYILQFAFCQKLQLSIKLSLLNNIMVYILLCQIGRK